MRKLKLEQPFASMVLSGALQTIPDKWGDVKIGEKILIYAGDISSVFLRSEFDFGSELDRLYSNERFFGNIPDSVYIINEYLGYVTVAAEGKKTDGWPLDSDNFLFVCNPHVFEQSISEYNENVLILDIIPNHPFKRNVMRHESEILYVPVGQSGWDEVRDDERFKNTYVYWEDYMEEIVFSPWGVNRCVCDTEIKEVHFIFGKEEIIFETNYSAGYNYRFYEKDGIRKKIEVFEFNLVCLSDFSKIGFLEKKLIEKISPRKQYVKIISTPMGGMTGWKRK